MKSGFDIVANETCCTKKKADLGAYGKTHHIGNFVPHNQTLMLSQPKKAPFRETLK